MAGSTSSSPSAGPSAAAGSSSTARLTVHLREHAAPGPLACRVRTRHLAHGLHEEDVEVWDSAGVLCAQSRQLAVLA